MGGKSLLLNCVLVRTGLITKLPKQLQLPRKASASEQIFAKGEIHKGASSDRDLLENSYKSPLSMHICPIGTQLNMLFVYLIFCAQTLTKQGMILLVL